MSPQVPQSPFARPRRDVRLFHWIVLLGAIAMSLVSILMGNLLYFLMGYPIHAVAFWADNVWSLDVARRVIAMLLGGGMLPLTLFWPWAQDVLAYLPFRYCYAVPAETLLGRVEFGDDAERFTA